MEGYMNNLLSANISNATAWGTILVVVLVIFLVIFFAIIAKFFKTWLRARLAKAPVSMSNMLGMWLRKVPYPLVVDTRITAAKAGLDISTDELEAHFLAGGDIVDCVLALIAAEKAGIPLSYDRACAIDLAVKGTSKTVLEAVRTSINPRVIDCPNPSSGQTRLTAVARDGIAVAVRARVTVRTNLDLFVGGRHGGNGGRPRRGRHRLRRRFRPLLQGCSGKTGGDLPYRKRQGGGRRHGV